MSLQSNFPDLKGETLRVEETSSNANQKNENSVNYLISLLNNREAKILKLEQESSKKDTEIALLVKALRKEYDNHSLLKDKVKQYENEIGYLVDLQTKTT